MRENLKLTPFTDDDKEAFETIEYQSKLKIDDHIQVDTKKDILELLGRLKEARKPHEGEWKQCDAIYDGDIERIEGQQFNVHYGIMAEKIDNAVNRAEMAFFDGERTFDISPRPDFAKDFKPRKDAQGREMTAADVAQKQSDFLDYKNEEVIKPREQVGLTFHSAFLKGNGWLFGTKKVIRKPVRERRVFKGAPIYTIQLENQQVKVTEQQAKQFTKETGIPFAYSNEGLDNFLTAFPEEEDSSYAKKLHKGKEVKTVASYDDVIYNDPYFEMINLTDIWVDLKVDNLYELAKTKLLVHRKVFTYWELRELEELGEFEDIDKILYKDDKDLKAGKKIPNAENSEFEVYRCTYWMKPTKASKKVERCIIWIAKDREHVIGAERYRHDRVLTEYLPFYVKKKKKGLIQPGVGKDLIDDNIALDLFVNFTLQVLYMHTMITPICETDSETYKQFHNKEFVNGMPLVKGKLDVLDFVNKHMQYPDINSVLALMNKVEQRAGEKSHITHGMTGKESPTDPSAPASKTLALLGEGNFNFKMYINTLAKSFNEIGYMELAMYHQMEKESIDYRGKDRKFDEITRDELVAKTEIQTQALAFAVDKLREKTELIAFYQLMRPEMQDREEINNLLRFITKSWSPKMRSQVDELMPTLDEVQRNKMNIAINAVQSYVQMQKQQEADTGVQPDPSLDQLMQMMEQGLADYANPPSDKEINRREKQAKQGS